MGYEVIGYFKDENNNTQNLNWFLNDSTIPEDFRLDLYNLIIEKAIHTYLKANEHFTLFLPYDAQILHRDNGETLLELLQASVNEGLNLTDIVIQVREDFTNEQMDSIQNLFNYMKLIGIQIAFDGVGERVGNLDRLIFLKPNIVQLNVEFLKDTELPYIYRDVHHSLSRLSQKIGATIMFKGITTYNQLNHAWRNGGRFYQGSYLKRPSSELSSTDTCKEKIQRDFQLFVNYERMKMNAQLKLMNQINDQFKVAIHSIQPNEPYDQIILKVGKACTNYAFRVYICNEEGQQLSSNAEKNKAGEWELQLEGKNKNWSWRPYFFENIARMNIEKKGILSDLYTDIGRDEQIRTYSYPIFNHLFIFIDISYDFLFEQEGLL